MVNLVAFGVIYKKTSVGSGRSRNRMPYHIWEYELESVGGTQSPKCILSGLQGGWDLRGRKLSAAAALNGRKMKPSLNIRIEDSQRPRIVQKEVIKLRV